MSYIELCKNAVETALKAGAKEAEALIAGGRTTRVEIERGEIKSCSDLMDIGLAVRTISHGKIGFAYTNTLTEKDASRSAKQAVLVSRASVEDRNWRQLPQSKRYPSIKEVYDKRVLSISSDKAVELSQRMIEASSEADKRVMAAFGGTDISDFNTTCVNSHGVEVEDKGSALVCTLGTMARSESQISPVCVEFNASRTYNVDPEWIGKKAARMAIDSLNVGKEEAGRFPVLFDPIALQDILTYTLIESVKGDNVHRGRSKLKEKTGKPVAADFVNISDNGTLAGGLFSGKTDMEGVPRQNTPIIEDGILQEFIYDNYWARLEKRNSTGNAQRGGGGLGLPPYCTVPSISPTNIVLKPGTASEQELLREVGTGYYVRSVQGAHQSNPETGDFSVAIAPAWRIEKGEIKHAVKGSMIAGNAYTILEKISLIGKETRQVGTFVAPKVVVSEANIITK